MTCAATAPRGWRRSRCPRRSRSRHSCRGRRRASCCDESSAASPYSRPVSSVRRLELAESPNQLTIEQLAAETGMSVRNIRAHQARGLLAPPEVRMRVGYYGPEHVAQLRLIRDLQDDGFNLAGIKRLLDDTHGTAERLLRFKRALTASTRTERAETLSISELAERFRISAEEATAVLSKSQKLGVLVPVGEDQYEVPSPSLLAA